MRTNYAGLALPMGALADGVWRWIMFKSIFKQTKL